MCLEDSGYVHDCGEAIVARLAAIDVVIGVYTLSSDLTSHQLDSSVRNDFVGVHV